MSYATTANRPSPLAALGAIGVPAAVGVLLVTGLTVVGAIKDKIDNPITVFIDPKPLPDPPVEPEQTTQQATQQQTVNQTFDPPVDTPFDFEVMPGPSDPILEPGELTTGPIGPVELPGNLPALPDPIAAKPSNQPSRWITDNDYRSRWVREEMSGVASFALTIDRTGKVSDCRITRSTGHSQLDQATCALIERRARFDPAKDSYGNTIIGTYSSSVNWQLPE